MNNTAENNSKNSNDINENSKSLRKLSVVVSVYNEEKLCENSIKKPIKSWNRSENPAGSMNSYSLMTEVQITV